MPHLTPRTPWARVATTCLAAAALAACAPSGATPVTPPAAGGAVTSFKGEVAPVLKASCAGCHAPGGSARPTFLGADGAPVQKDVAGNVGRIVASVESGRMPKGSAPKLTAAQVATLKAWQAAGSPDN